MTATSFYNYVVLLKNGSRLNFSVITQDFYVDVSVPIRDLELANFNYAKYFEELEELEYDIYNSSRYF